MSQEQFLDGLVSLLKDAGMAFMISGSLASSFHGEPRTTNDLDLVVDPNIQSLNRFIDSLPGDWYVSREAALHGRTVFNVIDREHG